MDKLGYLRSFATRIAGIVGLVSLALSTACTVPYAPLQDLEPVSPTTELAPPQAATPRTTTYSVEQVNRGEYMVNLLGCAICHTDGALIGEPNYALNLAGSGIGIAYSNPLVDKYPAVVYPPNITPDIETGIGGWSESELVQALRSGRASQHRKLLAVMPWPTYAGISDFDAAAISAYLLSLPPIKHRVPDNVPPGKKASNPYVHFGVYRSRR